MAPPTQQQINELADTILDLESEIAATLDAFGGVPDRICQLRHHVVSALDGWKERLEPLNALAETTMDAVVARAEEIGVLVKYLNETIENGLEAIRDVFPTQLGGDVVKELDEVAQQQFETMRSVIGSGVETLDETAGSLAAALADLQETVVEMIETLRERISEFLADLLDFFKETYVTPVTNELAAAAKELAEIATEQIAAPLAEQAKRITTEIGEVLSAIIDALAERLAQFLAEIRDGLVRGDEDALARREVITEALDTLRGVLEPLEEAFESFRSLARAVGVPV